MNDFITNLVEDIMETIKEDKEHTEHFLRNDIQYLLTNAIKEHDKEVMEQAKDMLDQDEIYDEGYDSGYAAGWESAKQEILDTVSEVYHK